MATEILVMKKHKMMHLATGGADNVGSEVEVFSSAWVDQTLLLEVNGVPSPQTILLYCLQEASKVSKCSAVVENCSYFFHESEEVIGKDACKTMYTQSLILRDSMYQMDDCFITIIRDLKKKQTSVKSTLVPLKAKIEIPSEDWIKNAKKDQISDEVWVGLDPRSKDPLQFTVLFQKPVYVEGERVSFVDSHGKVVGHGRTNNFLDSVYGL